MHGTVGGYEVTIHLFRTENRFNGFYQYVKAYRQNSANISTSGHMLRYGKSLKLTGYLDPKRGRIKLLESESGLSDRSTSDEITGTWDVTLDHDSLRGTWSHDTRHLPVIATKDSSVPALPFQMEVGVRTPDGFNALDSQNLDRTCLAAHRATSPDDYFVGEIYLFRDNKLVQLIDGFKASRQCGLSFPRIRDIRFNGKPAIVIKLSSRLGSDSFRIWEYDADKDQFVVNQAFNSVQSESWQSDWNGPIFDRRTHTLNTCWTSFGPRGASSYGSVTYRWNGEKLKKEGSDDCFDSGDSSGRTCERHGKAPGYHEVCESGAFNVEEPLAW
jgi:hypothetical protein